jgi:50S ribosomal subunit-associated GTPase HflX
MSNTESQRQVSVARKEYRSPRLIAHGSVARLTAAKSGGTSDSGGSRGQALPPIKKYR